ncbi:fimbrial protein [Herbaspirillum rhizosphaerae]|uniref:Fimbrial protein n=1 Tax=Herbaspirillum rhizosphaerae TaxID=346179 RepID=A0ABW8Z2T6_9BURK
MSHTTHSTYAIPFYLSYGAMQIITPTCNIPVVPTVMLDAVSANSFSGTGSVSRDAPKHFMIPLQCAGKSGAAQIGVSFSSAYRDASGAPGVIKTDQGANRASGVGLKIVNETTRQPISFDTLEPGPTPFKTTGTNNFPFSVNYFQTGAKITPGNVTGRVEVSIAYQ